MERLELGDCLQKMRLLQPDTVDLVCTSPPYAQQRKNLYGGIPEKEYPQWTVEWMNSVKPLLKPNGSVAIVIRPHLWKGSISDYVLRTRLAIRGAGWNECDEMIWIKSDSPPLGSVLRPRRSWESILWFSQAQQPYCDPKSNGKQSNRLGFVGNKGEGKYVDGLTRPENWIDKSGIARCQDFVEVGTSSNDYSAENTHPAQYPMPLASWIINLLCPPGGTVLDPFMGSGSTGCAAKIEGREFVGIELQEKYFEYAKKRMESL